MSTALAVAATSRVIAAVIDDAVASARLALGGVLGGATTSCAPPDHLQTDVTKELTNLNLFLYHVTYNQGWREVGLPTRASDGKSAGRAPLAIDLHYLLSAYSAGDYEAQIMLGIGMQALHEVPVLFRKKIQNVFAAPSNAVDKALATANLADQIEMVKIVPQQVGTEELSKLWTAFQSKFRVSAAYAVSVLLIESQALVTAPLPVLARRLVVLPFLEPHIGEVAPQIVPFAAAATLALTGSNLTGKDTEVVFDGNPAAPQAPLPGGDSGSISVAIPPLAAGINTVRVVRRIDLDITPKTPFVESNVASFMLQPVIQKTGAGYQITVGAPDAGIPPRAPVTVLIDPTIGAKQKVSLLLNPLNPPPNQDPLGLRFDAVAADISPPHQVVVRTQGVPAGDYLARVRVDGADSPLDIDAGGKFVGPKVTF
jgi:hypothetical protein